MAPMLLMAPLYVLTLVLVCWLMGQPDERKNQRIETATTMDQIVPTTATQVKMALPTKW